MSFDGFTPPPPSRTMEELSRTGFRRYTALRRQHRMRQAVAVGLAVLVAGASVPLLLWRTSSVEKRLVDRPSERREGAVQTDAPPPRSQGLNRSRDVGELPALPGLVPGAPGDDETNHGAGLAIAFMREGTLFSMHGYGSDQVRVSRGTEFERDPDWSPDGRKIVMTSDDDLAIVDLARKRMTKLAITGDVESAPSWSPDGKRIAFTQDGDICVIDADGSGFKNVTNTSDVDEYTSSWSPDGRRLVFALNSSSGSGIYVMKADGSGRKRLTSGQDLEPEWSPDGSKVLFTRYDISSNSPSDIYVMNADGSGQRNLTLTAETFEYAADWSPDGRQIAYTWDTDGRYNPVNDPFANAVACTAARVCRGGSKSAIYVMRSDGSSRTALTAQDEADESPSFKPFAR